jgi:exodeoxyribonuclease V beta subunit
VVVPGVARATRHAAEVEFLFPLRDPAGRERALLQGAIDLVFEWQGRIYWLDWKSDQLPEDDPAALAAHVAAEYSIQAEIYSLALARMIGAHSEEEYRVRFGGLVYLFLRGARVHAERPSWSELTAREAALAEREVLG